MRVSLWRGALGRHGVLFLATAAILAGCDAEDAPAPTEVRPVRVITV